MCSSDLGEADFIINLEEGTYLTTLDFGGNKWYCDATNAATIVVSKKEGYTLHLSR